jgi:hypothetical protein
MDWDYIISTVAIFYCKLFAVFVAYGVAKHYDFIAHNVIRSKSSPHKLSKKQRCIRYAGCVTVVLVISLIYGFIPMEGGVGGDDAIKLSHGFIVFLVLVFPAVIGLREGFTIEEDPSVKNSSHLDDYNDVA